MSIVPAGRTNTTALVVPDLYVQIIPPQPALNGVPSNIIGVVGGATWGPKNVPTPFGSYAEFQGIFGPMSAVSFDMGTAIAVMTLQGANDFVGVRVTDGSDAAATLVIDSNISFTALYTGSLGDNVNVQFTAGGKPGTYNVIVALPGVLLEQYSNIGGSGNTFWQNVAAAVNGGQGPLRGPSQLVRAIAELGSSAPVFGNIYGLSGGTDGTSGLNTDSLVGSSGTPRTGMYTLEKQNCSLLLLVDATDYTAWTTIDAFAQAIGAYAIVAIAAGTSITSAVTIAQTVGVDDPWVKIMHGDWLLWYDQVNGLTRLVSPASFACGVLGALDPSQSSLNKKLQGIAGSQTAGVVGTPQKSTYSSADLTALLSTGIDVICLPAPGGPYWAVRGGINSSLNDAVNGDNYTRMTDYIAATLNAGMGIFVGQKITTDMDREAVATIASFLSTLQQQGLLGSPTDPPPYIVTGGLGPNTPNPQSRTALGYYQINVAVTYAPINRFFIINLQGGQTVVTSQPLGALSATGSPAALAA